MKCPVCSKPMKKVSSDTSYNTAGDKKAYERTIYHCLADDVWANIEIPKDKPA